MGMSATFYTLSVAKLNVALIETACSDIRWS
jgi:hypothetical protein